MDGELKLLWLGSYHIITNVSTVLSSWLLVDGAIPGGVAAHRGGDRRDFSPPRHHPTINQAVDTYFDQYMDSVRHRQGDAGYQKQSYKYARGMGYNAP